jgi:hypothetical protein
MKAGYGRLLAVIVLIAALIAIEALVGRRYTTREACAVQIATWRAPLRPLRG